MVIEYRLVEDVSEFERIVDLEIDVWGLSPRDAVPSSILHALVCNGSVLIAAYDADRIVGMAFAFPVRHGKRWMLWSHMTGVHPDYQGRGIGFDLKQRQRLWALEHGYDVIGWTFDPLQRGNANFNLRQLGVKTNIYHINFYGEMVDAINHGLPSDRVEAVWNLRDRQVKALANGKVSPPAEDALPEEYAFLLRSGENAHPVLSEFSDASRYIEIPYDLSYLKRQDKDLAHAWRLALREAMVSAFNRGYTAVDFSVQGDRCWYVLSPPVPWSLYVLECRDQTLYTGITNDIPRRLARHNAGRGAAYTAARRPVKLLAAWEFADRSSALKAETAFKQLTRQAKLDLIAQRAAYRDARIVED
ncbi:MAG: GNAT family N-acetyltransferase [Chloroflexi bacterium]|nr:GNAT family N-acetyltransferase [Chloroflexota bacterium]